MLRLNIIRPQPAIDETWSVERIAREAPPPTWEEVFKDALPELHDVTAVLTEQERDYGAYYPLRKDIFAAFQNTRLTNVKVVILGQDPYHQTISLDGKAIPRAMGLSFSVRKGDAIPASLNNIYKELQSVKTFVKPDHGDLTEWTHQGVLLLNTSLTVRPNCANSHGNIWHGFVSKVIKAIATVNPYCIYLLWGREAQNLRPMLRERNIALEAAHPSGFSAMKGFFNCNHFNLVNDLLVKQGKVPINWSITSLAELRALQNAKLQNDKLQNDKLPTSNIINIVKLQLPPLVLSLPTVPSVAVNQILPLDMFKFPSEPEKSNSFLSVPTVAKDDKLNNSDVGQKAVVPIIPKIVFGTTPVKANTFKLVMPIIPPA